MVLLHHEDLHALHSLLIDEGALPFLENFVIGPSLQLKEVPFGIQHLRSLKELKFLGMPKEFKESLDPKKMQHY